MKHLLGPFYLQDQMIIPKARQTLDCFGCTFTQVEVDEGKTLWNGGLNLKTEKTFCKC